MMLLNNLTTPRSYSSLLGLRWAAWFGQFITCVSCSYAFNFYLPVEEITLILSVSLAVLIVQSIDFLTVGFILRQNVAYGLFYDLTQLFSLLFVTGGLNNPFCLLLIGPMAVSSTFLEREKSFFITCVTFIYVFLLWLSPYSLPWSIEIGLLLPKVWLTGNAVALLVASSFISIYVGLLSKNSKKLQDAIQLLKNTLEQEKSKAKLGTLAAATAHELGTPLASMTFIVEDLLEEHFDDSTRKDILLLQEQLLKCRQILRALDKDKTGHPATVFPIMTLKDGLEALIKDHQKIDISYELTLDISSQLQMPNSYEINYIFSNILSNAFSYSKNKVIVTVTEDEKKVQFNIQDDGPGFLKTILPRLGLPFNSTRSLKTNTNFGLGLYIASQLAKELKAKIYFSNNNGARATVIFDKSIFLP